MLYLARSWRVVWGVMVWSGCGAWRVACGVVGFIRRSVCAHCIWRGRGVWCVALWVSYAVLFVLIVFGAVVACGVGRHGVERLWCVACGVGRRGLHTPFCLCSLYLARSWRVVWGVMVWSGCGAWRVACGVVGFIRRSVCAHCIWRGRGVWCVALWVSYAVLFVLIVFGAVVACGVGRHGVERLWCVALWASCAVLFVLIVFGAVVVCGVWCVALWVSYAVLFVLIVFGAVVVCGVWCGAVVGVVCGVVGFMRRSVCAYAIRVIIYHSMIVYC